jgi:hypothetical protein
MRRCVGGFNQRVNDFSKLGYLVPLPMCFPRRAKVGAITHDIGGVVFEATFCGLGTVLVLGGDQSEQVVHYFCEAVYVLAACPVVAVAERP